MPSSTSSARANGRCVGSRLATESHPGPRACGFARVVRRFSTSRRDDAVLDQGDASGFASRACAGEDGPVGCFDRSCHGLLGEVCSVGEEPSGGVIRAMISQSSFHVAALDPGRTQVGTLACGCGGIGRAFNAERCSIPRQGLICPCQLMLGSACCPLCVGCCTPG